MKNILLLTILLMPCFLVAQICNPSGNMLLYSNYDGGYLTISVDENIPNLKIGVVSYEAAQITITGPFSGNVTEVIYVGYNSQNSTNCVSGSNPIATTTISAGAAPSQILVNTQATLQDPNGYSNMICAYNCSSSGSSGGCNSVNQVVHFFMQQWPGSTLRYHQTQYGCWPSGSINLVSAGGNCCIMPLAPPIAAFTFSNDSLCPGECVTLINTSINPPFNAVAWSIPGAVPSSASGDTVTVCYPGSGTFSVGLTVSNAAGSDNALQNAAVNVLNPPVLPVIQLGTNLLFFNSSPMHQYQWLLNGSPISGQLNDTLVPTGNGAYSVISISANGCSDTSAVFNLVNLSLSTPSAEVIRVYPNPASDFVRFESDTQIESYYLFDQLGKIVKYSVELGGRNSEVFNTSDLPEGIYTLQFIGNGFTSREHLLILHP